MKKSIKNTINTLLLSAGILGSSFAFATPSVDEIVNRTNFVAYYQGQDGKAKVKMTITDEQGRERTRQFVILRSDEPQTDSLKDNAYKGEQKMYVYFSRPADVNKMVFMVWKRPGGTDDRWLYLPALDLVKRIASSDKRTSFVGSDFYYEDVSGRNLEDDTHELISTDENYYVIKNTPVKPELVEFSYYTMYIHKETFLPIQTEYYDKKGNLYRTNQTLKVDTIAGFPTVTQSSMENLKTKTKTLMEYSKVSYNLDLPKEIYTERFLRKAPRKLLR